MTTLLSTDAQHVCDNLAQSVADALALLPSSLSTITTDLATELTRIQSIADQDVQAYLGSSYRQEARSGNLGLLPAGTLLTWLNSFTYAKLLQNGPAAICEALDFLAAQTSGSTSLASFLTTNSLLVDQYFADLFNQYCNDAASGAYLRKLGSQPLVSIPSTSIFVHANADYTNQWTASGASTGTLIAGTNPLAIKTGGVTIPGGGVLEAYAGGTIGASSYTITVTYTPLTGGSNTTMTFTIPSGTTANTVFTPSGTINVGAVVSVAVTSGSATSGDVIRFRMKPVRSIAA